jgi:hypothetical protein
MQLSLWPASATCSCALCCSGLVAAVRHCYGLCCFTCLQGQLLSECAWLTQRIRVPTAGHLLDCANTMHALAPAPSQPLHVRAAALQLSTIVQDTDGSEAE